MNNPDRMIRSRFAILMSACIHFLCDLLPNQITVSATLSRTWTPLLSAAAYWLSRSCVLPDNCGARAPKESEIDKRARDGGGGDSSNSTKNSTYLCHLWERSSIVVYTTAQSTRRNANCHDEAKWHADPTRYCADSRYIFLCTSAVAPVVMAIHYAGWFNLAVKIHLEQ